MLRTLILLLSLAGADGEPSLNATDLQRMYGDPTRATFQIRPCVEANAKYGRDGKVTELTLVPTEATGRTNSDECVGERDWIAPEVWDELFNELLPTYVRGDSCVAFSFEASRNGCDITAFDHAMVSVTYSGDRITRVIISFEECRFR